jgi:hypothetical protein
MSILSMGGPAAAACSRLGRHVGVAIGVTNSHLEHSFVLFVIRLQEQPYMRSCW